MTEQEIENRIYFTVCTKNKDPELKPLELYEVERGRFDTEESARTLAKELSEAGEDAQIFKSVRIVAPLSWYPAKN